MEYSNSIQTDTYFASYQAALEYVFKLAEKESVILTTDKLQGYSRIAVIIIHHRFFNTLVLDCIQPIVKKKGRLISSAL